MKVKKRKRNKLLATLVIIVLVFAAVLYFNNISQKYYSSVKSEQKKSTDDELAHDVYEIQGPSKACQEGLESFGISIVVHTKAKADGTELTEEEIDKYLENNTIYDINCVPDENWFEKAGVSGGSFPLTIGGANKSTYNCIKGSDYSNTHPLTFVRSGKGVTVSNAQAFKAEDGTTCPAGSVKMVYKDLTVLGGDSNPAVTGTVSQATVEPTEPASEDYDGYDGVVALDGTVDLDDHGSGAASSSDADNANSIEAIGTAPDAKDYEIVKYLGISTPKTFKDFETAFKALPTATQNKNKRTAGTETKTISGEISLSCNYKLTRTDIDQIETYNRQSLLDSDGKITNYYYDPKNTTYYRGYWKKVTPINISYVYHNIITTNGKSNASSKYKEKKSNSIKKTSFNCVHECTEYVKVEYGPPIQVGGGMCFEYRVRVSSVVNCTAKTSGNGKPEKRSYCALVPHCSGGHHQAGPNEDFENCVSKCDNGEYSKYCSDKCYKEVYENSNSLDLVERSVFDDMDPDHTIETFYYNNPDGSEASHKGCIRGQHYINSKGNYDWCPAADVPKAIITNNKGKNHKNSTQKAVRTGLLGIWYYIQKYKTHWYNSKYASDANGLGIIRAQYKHGQCRENCWWSLPKKCKAGSYIAFNNKVSNSIQGGGKCSHMYVYVWDDKAKKYSDTPVSRQVCDQRDLIKYDYANNNRKYIKEMKEKCVGKASCTTTTSTYTISFKYKKSKGEVKTVTFPYSTKDELKSNEKGGATNNKPKGALIRFGGCYAHSDNTKWYLAEWTFPGTWLSNKSGDPVYGKPDNENQYVYAKGKVCVPYGLADTNAKWAVNYIKYQKKDSGEPSGWEFDEKRFDNKDSANGYNIQAETTEFGYFHWHFKINCFYALANNPTNGDCVNGDKDCPQENYEVRSFDSQDPFLQTAQASSRIQYKIDRKIGFNWTKGAQLNKFNRNGKSLGAYDVDPEAIREKIMETKDTYSEDNLDYKVHIDVGTLKKIRERNKEMGKYTNMTGMTSKGETENRYSAGNGVSHYHSKLLSDLGITDIDESNGNMAWEIINMGGNK